MTLSPPLTDRQLRALAEQRGAVVRSDTGLQPIISRSVGEPQERGSLPPSSPAVATKHVEPPTTLQPLTFWIPRPPDNANARGHSRQANRVKKAYWRELDVRKAARVGFPDVPSNPLQSVTVNVTYFCRDRRNMLDNDNAIRRLKPFVDFLVGHEYLAGDKAHQVQWGAISQELMTMAVMLIAPPLCSVRVVLIPIPAPTRAGAGGEPGKS